MNPLPVWKKLLFTGIPFFAFFLAVEILLSFFGVQPAVVSEDPYVGFAESIPLFEQTIAENGEAVYQTAFNKHEFFNFQRFPAKKDAAAFRIFCLGGSTTFGRPYADPTSYVGWLREFLKVADPARKYEVINCGGISYASYRVAALMEELVSYEPDMFIVLSGHNEFLEERTYRQLTQLPAPLLYLNGMLSRTRTFTGLRRLLIPLLDGTKPAAGANRFILAPEVDDILGKTLGPTSYHRNDQLQEQIIGHYRSNLKRMTTIAESHDVALLFINPVINRKDMSPFKSENSPELTAEALAEWQQLFQKGSQMLLENAPENAIAILEKAYAIDRRHAELCYLLGRAFLAAGNFSRAEKFFREAASEDICPLRILPVMQEYLLQFTEENDVMLLDFDRKLQESALKEYGSSLIGNEYLLDHIHPKIEIHSLLAQWLIQYLADEKMIPAVADWNNAARVALVTSTIRQSVNAEYQATALANLGQVFAWSGKYPESFNLLKAAEKIAPNDSYVLGELANWYNSMGDRTTAIVYFLRALKTDPTNAKHHNYLAHIYQVEQNIDEAYFHYRSMQYFGNNEERGEIEPFGIELALRYGSTGQFPKALFLLQEAERMNPPEMRIFYNLAKVYDHLDDLDQSESYYFKALEMEPENPEILNNIGVLKARNGNHQQAGEFFSKAIATAPSFLNGYLNMARLLAETGREDEAEKFIQRAQLISQ